MYRHAAADLGSKDSAPASDSPVSRRNSYFLNFFPQNLIFIRIIEIKISIAVEVKRHT